jgi:glycosyltransferase involved in cell wall biosynthesis
MKVIHIITGLGDGGAENSLYKICKYDHFNKHIVISLTGPSKYFFLLKKLGITVYCFNFRFFSIINFFNLKNLLQSLKPDVVQTWLVHGDFIGSICARFAGFKNIVWNVRYSNIKIGKAKLFTILLIRILSKLSFLIPKLIVVVSKSSKKNCIKLGYDKKKLYLIPNGYDLSIFKPNIKQKTNFKKKYRIKKKIPLIGIVARYDIVKDHENLINALSLIKLKNINFLCYLIGKNMDRNNNYLVSKIKKLKLDNFIKLLGATNNISQIMNALDVHILCSTREGFPNVVAEAMCCGTPCIVTDVGDSAFIVGKTGWVIPPKNTLKLAEAIEKALLEIDTKNWKIKCYEARFRIKNNFDIMKMVKSYNKVWRKAYK